MTLTCKRPNKYLNIKKKYQQLTKDQVAIVDLKGLGRLSPADRNHPNCLESRKKSSFDAAFFMPITPRNLSHIRKQFNILIRGPDGLEIEYVYSGKN